MNEENNVVNNNSSSGNGQVQTDNFSFANEQSTVNVDNLNNQNLNNMPQTLGQVVNNNQDMSMQGTDAGVSNTPMASFDDDDKMDNSFVEPKKSPVGIIIVILLILAIIGGCGYYYFFLDSPKTIFTTIVNKLNNTTKLSDYSLDGKYNYQLNVNASTDDKNMQAIFNIVNKVALEGSIGIDNDDRLFSGTVNYDNKKLVDYNLQIDSINSVVYVQFSNLFDKIIKLKLENDDSDSTLSNYDVDIKDYEQVFVSVKTAVVDSLETATYKKEYVKLNDKMVKKMSLNLDENFLTTIYNKLLQDSKFLESYAKISNISTQEVSDMLNKEIDDAKGNDEVISVYLTILGNEFIQFEYKNSEDSLTVLADNDRYSFDVVSSYTSKYHGYVKLGDTNKQENITVYVELVDEEIKLEVNVVYSKEDEKMKLLDTSKAVNYEDLTEEDMNGIMTKVMENEAIIELVNDLGLNDNELSFGSSM